MSSLTQKEQVKIKLQELGDKPTVIAGRLDYMGIKGVVGSTHTCPLANYLKACFPGLEFSVDGQEVEFICDVDSLEETTLSLSLSREQGLFVSDFDDGFFPQLKCPQES
jgi:hypothetical protein